MWFWQNKDPKHPGLKDLKDPRRYIIISLRLSSVRLKTPSINKVENIRFKMADSSKSLRRKHGRNEDLYPKLSQKKAKIEKVNVTYLHQKDVSVFDQIRFRERGNIPQRRRRFLSNIFTANKFGTSLELYISEDRKVSNPSTEQGSIFNLEFSPNNEYLVAACENRAILLFDPCRQKSIRFIRGAHEDAVNCVTFLDNRTFATCSDDKNICLWDIRNTNKKIFTLRGHTSWVKSINYDKQTKTLVSSAFDDTVRTWNIENFTNDIDSIKSTRVMKIPYLTRTKLMCHNESSRKLVAGTNTGIVFVVHNLDFDTLRVDSFDTMKVLRDTEIDCKDLPVVNLTDENISNRIEFITEFANDVDLGVLHLFRYIHRQNQYFQDILLKEMIILNGPQFIHFMKVNIWLFVNIKII